MKIKTITCHDVYNYGASLQAYSLLTYLSSLGHEVEIIDYLPHYMRVYYKFWLVPKQSRFYQKSQRNFLLKFLLCCYFAPHRFATFARKRTFDSFKKKYLRCTRKYYDYSQLMADPPDADVYIAGSDQIWNCALDNGSDPSFYLQFGTENVKRIAYAASLGIPQIPDYYKKNVKFWLGKFHAISVREKTGVSALKEINVHSTNVLDPVFLSDVEVWCALAGDKQLIKGGYVAVYDLGLADSRIRECAKQLSANHNIPIVSIDALGKCPYADLNISNAGPCEFVNIISNASFVVTDSFHASSFSIIFHKEFYTYYNGNNMSRISDLLGKLGLSTRLNARAPWLLSECIDWKVVDEALQLDISRSKEFIEQSLAK